MGLRRDYMRLHFVDAVMKVTTEISTVFRGGGRRWFTKKSAIRAEAKALYRACLQKKDRCDCERADGYATWDYPGNTCEYHDHSKPVYGRYMRYAEHCITKAST